MNYTTMKCLQRVAESKKIVDTNEDGTVADLGPVPTGHKKDFHHSLDIDENDLDDGW